MALVSLHSIDGLWRAGKLPEQPGFAMPQRRAIESISAKEQDLLDAARSGDRGAQERLLEPFRTKLTRFFVNRVRDADEAANLAQQTLFDCLRQLPNFRGDCPFDRWVWKIAGGIAVRSHRQRARLAEWDDEFERAEEPSENGFELNEWLQEVLACAKEACTQSELTVMLLYYQTGSMEETATLAELNSATVRSLFLRGRASLLAHLVRHSPNSLGGEALILSVAHQLLESGGERGLTIGEYEALQRADYPSKTYRAACVKVARQLPNPAFSR